MNREQVKTYAPQARRDFIQAMRDRAAFYGLTAQRTEPVIERGDVAVIAGREHPRSVARKRRGLETRIQRNGFEPTMEVLAYTWFNRFVAIRFMELHGYFEHGFRVLSHPEAKALPEILEYAEYVRLPGLLQATVIDLKLAGNKEAELYRLLLTAQCNALHAAMPFLFEEIDDETELLLPDNLLHSTSLVRKLVDEIDEDSWKRVEIIGWLYQWYISEKKDQIIGKVVANEDIPAATQLFTPSWVVKYLVQNTLGRLWLAAYPQSALRSRMEFYIEPTKQTPEVHEQLSKITPLSLDPEKITILEPACGSGHILVEAYDLFKAIYLERGYRLRDVPALILKNNLFGLEIDDRSAQLAAFALTMKARADDPRMFEGSVKPNILSFHESKGLDPSSIANSLNSAITESELPHRYLFDEIEESEIPLLIKVSASEPVHVATGNIASLLSLFENAKTFGSLIRVPPQMVNNLAGIEKRVEAVLARGDLVHEPAKLILPFIKQARMLSTKYDIVLANPPYMGSRYYSSTLKQFVNYEYSESRSDLYTCFIQRNVLFSKDCGFVGMITIPNWMFLSSFEAMRKSLLRLQTIDTFLHNGRGVFGSDFGSCSFAVRNSHLPEFRGSFRRLFDKQGSVASNDELIERFGEAITYTPRNADFAKLPGSPLAYWVSVAFQEIFKNSQPIKTIAHSLQGMITGDNNKFLRCWFEVDFGTLSLGKSRMSDVDHVAQYWLPYNKGGELRKWYGNNEFVLNWRKQGRDLTRARTQNTKYYLRPCVTWTFISASFFAARYCPEGFVWDVAGSSVFPNQQSDVFLILGLLSSCVGVTILNVINPTVNYQVENIIEVPVHVRLKKKESAVKEFTEQLIELAKLDWDGSEVSWDFISLPICQHAGGSLRSAQEAADTEYAARFVKMKEIEESNNRIIIEAYGLQNELSPQVPDDQITLYRPNREEDIKRLVSFTVGCIMGRYSLDVPGIVYARRGNQGFDSSKYAMFPADDDGIVPVLERDWGVGDDAAHRVEEFVRIAWPGRDREENLEFIAEGLRPTNDELARATIRRYLATGFYKHHLIYYKRRPIYWLFSSGRQRAFQALVYLHRYNEGTLARMRTEYVIPLQGQVAARIERLDDDKSQATSTSHRRNLQKEQDDLKKQQAELIIFEEKLKHYADQRISLDLDHGVKANYGKFGDLLAEVKAVTGDKDDE